MRISQTNRIDSLTEKKKDKKKKRNREKVELSVQLEWFMVLCCVLAFVIAMLKRRASKRFVLAENGQEDVAWDSSIDNNNASASNTIRILSSDTNANIPNNIQSENATTAPTTTSTLSLPTTGLK